MSSDVKLVERLVIPNFSACEKRFAARFKISRTKSNTGGKVSVHQGERETEV